MATFIDLNSIYRDRESFPNPFNYELTPKQVSKWFAFARTTRAYGQNPGNMALAFVLSVKLKDLTLPYSDALADQPRVYVNFSCLDKTIKSIYLLQTIDGVLPDATFVCPFQFIQNDSGGTPAWIHYKCDVTQQNMRFKQGIPIEFVVTLPDGTPVPGADNPIPQPPDPTQQTFATIELLPYLKNAAIDNHLVDTITPQ